MNFISYSNNYKTMGKFLKPLIFTLSVLLIGSTVFGLNAYATSSASVNVKIVSGQSSNPLSIQAPNGTNYFLLDPNGLVKLAKNHKICLDNSCVTYLISDGTTLSIQPQL